MAEVTGIHVYGTADQASRKPPPAEGLEGHKETTDPNRSPIPPRQVALGDGNVVTLESDSGTVYAEEAGKVPDAPPPEPHDQDMAIDTGRAGYDLEEGPWRHAGQRWAALLLAGAAGALLALWLGRRRA